MPYQFQCKFNELLIIVISFLRPPLSTLSPYLFVPDQEYAAGVFGGVGKATVYVLHEDVRLLRVQGVDRLLHVSGSEAGQHVQHYVEVPLLGMR